MAQQGLHFVPQVLVIVRGTIVDFRNDGPEQHNVHWVTTMYSDNLGTYRAGTSVRRVFDQPGV